MEMKNAPSNEELLRTAEMLVGYSVDNEPETIMANNLTSIATSLLVIAREKQQKRSAAEKANADNVIKIWLEQFEDAWNSEKEVYEFKAGSYEWHMSKDKMRALTGEFVERLMLAGEENN